MKFKKLFSFTLCTVLFFSMSGCSQSPQEATVTPLTLMEKVNTRNIVDGNNEMRLWYDITPVLFSKENTNGSLQSILQDVSLFSDGDLNTKTDLNMDGILLNDVLVRDQTNAPKDFGTLNPDLGTLEDLAALCQQAQEVNMAVMLAMDFTCISKENAQFIALTELLTHLQEGEDPNQKDPVLMDMFFIGQNKENEPDWIRIADTSYFYQAFPQTDSPRINLESTPWRQSIITAVENYFSLGVDGFYVEDYENLFPGESSQRDVQFMEWFSSITYERNDQVINVFSFDTWTDSMSRIPAFASETSASGADGMIAQAVTGAISARDLGFYLENQTTRTENMCAFFLNHHDESLDLLKSEARLPQYKMALALLLMMNGQIFMTAGDEFGLPSSQADLLVKALESNQDSPVDQEDQEIDLLFGNFKEQLEDGSSILNFVQQAILLRNSYKSISQAPMTLSQEFSTDQVLILDRKSPGSQTVLIFNLSDQPQTVDTSFITISDLPAELGGVLLTGTEEITKTDQMLYLPPYSMALLK